MPARKAPAAPAPAKTEVFSKTVAPARPARTAAPPTAKPRAGVPATAAAAGRQGKPTLAAKLPPADKAPKAARPAKQSNPAMPAMPVKAAKPAKVPKAVKPPKPPKAPKLRLKPVRDGFTMPEADFALIGTLKARAMSAQRETRKSELLRAGLHALAAMDIPTLVAALGQLEPVKIGRPKKGH